MKYRVSHTTEYRYGESVPLCHNVIRMRPRRTARQVCQWSDLAIFPAPAARRDRIDFYGNHATWVSLQERHDVLRIEAVSEVEVWRSDLARESVGPAWETVAPSLMAPADAAALMVREYTFNSPYVKSAEVLADYARASFPPGQAMIPAVMDLTRRIHTDFTFDTKATVVGTPVLEVLQHRRGVCQDFAHLQIGCLRSLGLPARYVSGYIVTRPPPGRRRLVGSDASHAWVSVYVPELGWIDFDPTNGLMPSDEHVTLGWARDYDDLSIVKGVLIGGHRQSLYVGVDVEPLDMPVPARSIAPAAQAPERAAL